MSAQLPKSIEADGEALAEGTRLSTREAIVVLCDRDGLENESIRAYLGATDTTREVATAEIARLLGWSNGRVEDVRADLRAKKRALEAERELIEATLTALEGY